MKKLIRNLALAHLLVFSTDCLADVHIRYNQAGYSPARPKQLMVIATEDIAGKSWRVTDENGLPVLSGKIGLSVVGESNHTALPFNYIIDLTEVNRLGRYQVEVENETEIFVSIIEKPYRHRLNDLVRFLRVARSGPDANFLTPPSHKGDNKAKVYRPLGGSEDGRWQPDADNKTVDMSGGWYDAGDYIKFTQTIAYTSYFLLRAYQESPNYFAKSHSKSQFVDIIDEAKYGLDYLLKTHPTQDEFIIQVSTGKDHKVGYRLAHLDTRDGKREALSAISPAQMGLTAAALAIGASVFAELKEVTLAEKYLAQANAIYARAKKPSALRHTAFERDATNDFYLDKESADNMGLAAIELYKITKDRNYLEDAKNYSSVLGAGSWAAWCCVTSSLNYRLAEFDNDASNRLFQELQGYRNYDTDNGNIWGIPMVPSWNPMPGSAIAGAYSGLGLLNLSQSDTSLLWDNLDYFFGRNNWGVSFIAQPDLLRPAVNVYSQVYQLTGEYPLGAVAEGPGSRQTYESLKRFFKPSELDSYFEAFNTPTQIFFDNGSNFQTMESTIVGQATTIYLLAVAEKVSEMYGVKSADSLKTAKVSHPHNQLSNQSGIKLDSQQQIRSGSGGALWPHLLLLLVVLLFRSAMTTGAKFNEN